MRDNITNVTDDDERVHLRPACYFYTHSLVGSTSFRASEKTHTKLGHELAYRLVALRWKISENPGTTTRARYFAAR